MSDVHSNPAALKTALEDAKSLGCEKYIFLGDITGYGYDVETAFALVKKSFKVILQGNHDSAAIGNEPERVLMACRNYDIDVRQGESLSARAKSWLGRLPHLYSEAGAAFAHANFVRPAGWGYIHDAVSAKASFDMRAEKLLFCGHTHVAGAWEEAKDGTITIAMQFTHPAVSPELHALQLEPNSRYIVNVGSVGHPRNEFCSTYVIWDTEEKSVAFRRLPFDFKDYVSKMVEAKIELPQWLSELLLAARS